MTNTKTNTNADVPAEFLSIFHALVKAIQPRFIEPDAAAVYWQVLGRLPLDAIQQSAEALARTRFWPNTGDWFTAAAAIAGQTVAVVDGSRRLEELDDLPPNHQERDEISKRLSAADQTALMARYGYPWPSSGATPERVTPGRRRAARAGVSR